MRSHFSRPADGFSNHLFARNIYLIIEKSWMTPPHRMKQMPEDEMRQRIIHL
ncbi:uncharacterized protein MYCFIDRAFT_176698 [Pseudocercospora fijiensis CIRAD86]|uniref:Uncharacterized protein n=1 Tax=Pseudocercospora fijiensis (strain CIRAD86) TaxID=383855 RepID=M3A9W9_PSEFD|nr:uncharacterized protein MYCFIDRAFT_176698 [Pseudocercospora fijiensis CIRAD86]EME81426.1 hypothetical protein MYCFIDRAFT_176698 [Pseudocercospora fijiensis CIRAD86]